MKILILGNTGMLGSAVEKYFKSNTDCEITTASRRKHISSDTTKFDYEFDAEEYIDSSCDLFTLFECDSSIASVASEYDYIINCIGIIKPFIEDIETAIKVNSLFPIKLANFCESCNNTKLIHITTDCVYSGAKGHYIESDLHDCNDIYGKTKSLGEPENCMVIRTSIIGEEINKFASFISWAKSQKGKTVNGYLNHFWNGVTTDQYARICQKIIEQNLWKQELYHVFSNDVTKYEMLTELNKKFNLELDIKKTYAKDDVDRTLRTTKDLNSKLQIPTFKQMVEVL